MTVPREAEKLLIVDPAAFVAERDRIARELRAEGRSDEAETVAGLRKPTAVVFAVNRAARDRSQAAKDAAEAALRVRKAQVSSQPDVFKKALDDLETALDLLAEVAVAHVAPRGKAPTDAMRRRVRDLLRSAVADDDARDALVRGALTEELEAVGFSPFAGMPTSARKRPTKKPTPSRSEQQEAKLREREKALRDRLAEAEQRLETAVKSERRAEREREAAERAVDEMRAKLDRLD